MNIGLDMMGGDYAPLEAVKGLSLFLSHGGGEKDITLYLFGDATVLEPMLREHAIPDYKCIVVHASQVIEMHEHPTKAFKEKRNSSISLGFHYLSGGRMDAFISAGNTGAMMVGALFSIKAIEGILRPSISTIIPKENGQTGLLLAGIAVCPAYSQHRKTPGWFDQHRRRRRQGQHPHTSSLPGAQKQFPDQFYRKY